MTVSIQYCSDLHLEFPENRDFLRQNPIVPVGDVLILAGDIVLLELIDKHKEFFDYLSDNFKVVYWIPGNHEYYHSEVSERGIKVNEKIRSNVFLVNNQTVNYNGVRFIFSTMWTKINQENRWIIQRGLSDFHVIKNKGKVFTPEHYNQLYDLSMEYIKNELKNNSLEKTVVATHHVPTLLQYPDKYKGSDLNNAFVIELFDFIADSDINAWIFGHHHHNADDFLIGNTLMMTNQLGYVRHHENELFNNRKMFNV